MTHSPDHLVVLKNGLLEIFTPDRMSEDPDVLNSYLSGKPFTQPLIVVYPENKDEVCSLVRLAAGANFPLIPVSSGQPHFHGGTSPEHGGIIVNFSKMNKIRKINTADRYAWIEPGVTYRKLIPELKKQGLKLVMPLLPRADKSVAASRLEREPVTIPKYQYDFIDPLLTLEIIYGNGEEFRTGSASGPGTLETLKADKVNPWGPGSVDYFRFLSGAQGTMGIITWAMTKVEVLPSMQKLFFIQNSDLKVLVDIMNILLRKRVVDECLVLNNVNLAVILAGENPGTYKTLKESLPEWTLITCLSGYRWRAEERIGVMEKYLREACSGAGVKPQETLPGLEGMEKRIPELLTTPWMGETYWKLLPRGSSRDIFFLSPLSRAAELTEVMRKTASKYRNPADIGVYIQPMVQGRGCHCEFNLFYDKSDPSERNEVNTLFTEASEALINSGAFFSRPYGEWAEMVYQDCPEQVLALKKLKDIFDPHHIFNPGKLCF